MVGLPQRGHRGSRFDGIERHTAVRIIRAIPMPEVTKAIRSVQNFFLASIRCVGHGLATLGLAAGRSRAPLGRLPDALLSNPSLQRSANLLGNGDAVALADRLQRLKDFFLQPEVGLP
jgi:hypothetical protein